MEKIWLIFFIPMLLVHYFMACLAMTTTNFTTDQYALLAFKAHITFQPRNVLTHNWYPATSCCGWIGVTCGGRHQRVTALNLSNMGLNGTIPPHLGNLSFLASLYLGNNSFHGHLPIELSSLRQLKVIHLGYNNFSGEVPLWFGIFPKLQHLLLLNNTFLGTIPTSLSNISKLETLSLSCNQLNGHIPKEIGSLTKLKNLFLKVNQLSGSIPPTIFNMSSLQILNLDSNSLTGSLPVDMCNHLPEIEKLYLSKNQIYGQIPPSLYKCKHLQQFSLQGNKFTGAIPREIGNLTMLKELYLGDNNLEGVIPQEMGNLISLETLNIPKNRLTGPIPSAIFNISSIKIMHFGDNNLSDNFPKDMWHHLPALELLILRNNKFMGSIPRGLENCTSLVRIDLGINILSGAIPHEMGNFRNLEILDLHFNSLTGLIPSKIFNISTMKLLSLSGNHLLGPLPSRIGLWLPNLEELHLWGNKLGGVIPSSISNASKLTILSLSNTSLVGFIPNTLGNLRHLKVLSVAKNFLTTEYSPTLELRFLTSLTNCKYLRFLWFSSNQLDGILPISVGNLSASLQYFLASDCKIKGSIPREIGILSNLIHLNLKNNELTGSIPPEVGRLQKLQGLNLGNNRLQGSIPCDLCHLKSLVKLALYGNKLSGSIPACVDKLTSSRYLYLDSNKLTSIIPSTLWSLTDILELNLASNSLSGYLSLDIGNLNVVRQIDLSRNQLSGNIPNITRGLQSLIKLSLANNSLQGPIPQSFSNLICLEVLDLSINNLSGVIPKSLEELLYLKYLNVSFNRLEGEIPNGGQFADFWPQSFMKNDALCGAPRLQVPPCKKGTLQRSRTTILLLLKYILPAIASIVLVAALIFVLIGCRKRKVKIPTQANLSPLAWRKISYREILQASYGFSESNLLGIGSIGSVYKGILSDGVNVAIKVFNLQLEGAFKSFDAECEVLCNIRHRNLIKIISSCANIDFKALVLEYMPSGSLEKWLYSHNYCLDIVQRLNIMIDVASALEYLHHGYSTPIVHCDLKPSNVLLDEDMVAHLGDFGIAKLLGEEEFMTQTKTLGTIGYMAPEYGSEGVVSTRGDVYSYGILLMETFTRKKPTNEMFVEEMSLKRWVKESLPHAVVEVADANLLSIEEEHFATKKNCISSILELALVCSVELPKERIDVKDVLATLNNIKTKFHMSVVGTQNM